MRRFGPVSFVVVVLLSLIPGFQAHAQTPIPANKIRIHYNRPDATYTGWTSTPSAIRPKIKANSPPVPSRSRALIPTGSSST